jgi:hypothetical protein
MPELFIEITPGCLEAGDLSEGIQIRHAPIAEDAGHLKTLGEFIATHTPDIEVTILVNVLYDAIKTGAKKYAKQVAEMRINEVHTPFTKEAMRRRIEEIRKLE